MRVLIALTLIGLSCTTKKDSSSTISFPLSNFLDKCTSKEKYSLKTIVDTVNSLKVDIPEGWDIQISNTVDLHGIFAMDTSILRKENTLRTILINSLDIAEPLDAHFKSELTGLRHDSIPIIEVGATIINKRKAFWVLTSRTINTRKSKDLLVYTKGLTEGKMLVVNISISDSNDFKDQFCSLKEVIYSITFLQNQSV